MRRVGKFKILKLFTCEVGQSFSSVRVTRMWNKLWQQHIHHL